MHPTLKLLIEKMDWEIREQCDRRYQALNRQYNYLIEKQSEHLLFTYSKGWFSEKYRILFALNSFYQIVMGPLASSSRGVAEIGVGSIIPISYGSSIKFNSSRNSAVNAAYEDFKYLAYELDIDEWWLNLNQADDIVYQIAKKIRADEQQLQ